MDIRLKKAIKNRGTVPYNHLKVEKVLELNGMSNYKKICINRICGRLEEFDSMDDLLIDFNGNDICLTLDGLRFCKDILAGYIALETVEEYISYIQAENKIVDCLNKQANTLRSCNTNILQHNLKNPPAMLCDESNNIREDFKQMIQLELKCRGRLYLAYIGLKNKWAGIWSRLQIKLKFGLV